MKEGWTYKKFFEVFDLQMGKTPSRDNPLYWKGQNTWVSISDLQHKYIDSSKEKITDMAVSESNIKIVRKGTVIMSFKLSVGRCAIATKDLFTNEAIMSFTPIEEGVVSPDYIYYYLKGYKWIGANKAVMGMTLNKRSISTNVFAYPPLSEQQRIVSELDLLSGIIEKKKAQLKEYDALAQSIFYDMFGDPVTNEKGWEVKKLGEVCGKITDGTHNSPINTEKGDYLYITAKNIKRDGIILDNITYVSADVHKSIYERCNPQYGDILYIKDGITTGIATINTLKEEFSLLSSVALLRPKECLINYYLKSVLNMPSQYTNIRESMGGAAITRLTIAKINVIKIPLPPLSLQQSFASKIEAIERQKSLIQQSITEAETLFNSRMDYWFN